MTNLMKYAEQCEAERLALQLSDDVLSYAEIEEDELLDLKFVRGGDHD